MSKNNLPEKLFILPLFSSIVSRLSLFVLSKDIPALAPGASAHQVQVQVSGPRNDTQRDSARDVLLRYHCALAILSRRIDFSGVVDRIAEGDKEK